MPAALGGEAAFAERNILISASSRLTIGEELRADLRAAYTDAQIDAALDRTLANMGSDRTKLRVLSQLRRQCSYVKQDAARDAARFAKANGSAGGIFSTSRSRSF
jgi:hypothetical protein